MCFKKRTISDQPPFTGRTVSGIVVGDFPGTVNDLEGPVPDFDDLKKEVLDRWPDMTYREFKDEKATRARFLAELNEAVLHVGEDGMLFFIMDTCHAESSTRNGGRMGRRKAFRGIGFDKVLVFSSSLSSQPSSDAQFPGGANGAWHYALLKTIAKGITYRQWFYNAKALLAKAGFTQVPVIEGSDELQDRLIFEGNVVTIQVSTHGGQIRDRDGDELTDQLDEVIYFVDGTVVDDEIRKIVEKAKRRNFAKHKLINTSMKARNQKKDWTSSWLQPAVSAIALLFIILTSTGVITGEQAAEASPLISSTLGAISTVITGVVALIGIFFKQDEPVV